LLELKDFQISSAESFEIYFKKIIYKNQQNGLTISQSKEIFLELKTLIYK
jgi:hypothetical protein